VWARAVCKFTRSWVEVLTGGLVWLSCPIEVTLEEMELPEDDVLEKLNAVSTARRVANLVRQQSLSSTLRSANLS